MYVAPEFHSTWEPIDHHERSRVGSDQPAWDELGAMDNVTGYPTPFMPGARRFDFGGRPNPIIVPMVREALRLILYWTPEKIQAYLRTLTDQLVSSLQVSCPLLDCKSREERCGHILGVRFRSWSGTAASSVSTLGQLLKERNVVVSVRAGWLRIAPYVFNTLPEMVTVAKLLSHLSLASYPSSTITAPTDGRLAVQMLQETISSSSQRRLKVIVTGSAGWLGQYCCQMLLREKTVGDYHIDLYAAYNKTAPSFIPPEQCVQLDLTDAAGVEGAIRDIRPDVVIHLAALSSPAVCHKNPDEARAVNCPVWLVDAVAMHAPHCLFVFSSTDLVYDGEHPPYRVDPAHPPAPETVYGVTKLAMETEVLRLPNGVVLRLSNMLGPPYAFRPAGIKFLQWLFESYRKGEKVSLRCDEIRSFVMVDDVLEIVYRAVRRCACVLSAGGRAMFDGARVFNVGGPEGLSRLDLGGLVAASHGARLVVESDEGMKSGMKSGPTGPSVSPPAAAPVTGAVWTVTSSSNAESIAATGIRNPRDVTMNSDETERVFGIRFTPPAEAVNSLKKEFASSRDP
jgi:dTDP-4-dehydrorhamnose reductase